MTKLKIVLFFVLPQMEAAANFLEALDENSDGKDDIAAKAIRVAVAALRELSAS